MKEQHHIEEHIIALQKITDKKSKKTILCLDFSQADM